MTRIDKPWGAEELIEVNDKYMVKRITMFKDHRCSLQYHHHKRETIYVVAGLLRILMGRDAAALEARVFRPGESITLEPGVIHRMEGVEEAVYLEASTPELDDVVRLADDYRRT